MPVLSLQQIIVLSTKQPLGYPILQIYETAPSTQNLSPRLEQSETGIRPKVFAILAS